MQCLLIANLIITVQLWANFQEQNLSFLDRQIIKIFENRVDIPFLNHNHVKNGAAIRIYN